MKAGTVAFAMVLPSHCTMTSAGYGADDRRPPDTELVKATFAEGCFWCVEHPFDVLDGVVSTTSGYSDGHEPDPTYREASAGSKGHAEVVQVLYDPRKISYSTLSEVFWRNIDPLTANAQFCDRGSQYRSAI